MKFRTFGADGSRSFVLVADVGDEAVHAVADFARLQDISAAQITAVGAFKRATVGWYDREAQEYRPIEVDQQCEVLAMVGDIALGDGSDPEPAVHAHAVLGLPDGTVRGGHLLEGRVWPTLEVIVREIPAELRKTYRKDVGLALIDVDQSGTWDE